jgi:hypothetical protein
MCLDLDVVPPLAGFRLYAILCFSTMFSLCLLYAFLKLLTVFDLLIAPGTMFQASLEPPLSSFFNFHSFYLKNSVLFREEGSIVARFKQKIQTELRYLHVGYFAHSGFKSKPTKILI